MRYVLQSRVEQTLSRGCCWLRVMCAVLLASPGLLSGVIEAAEHTRPWRIGALNASWGPTPSVVGLRDGLQELGYRENENFVLGVRFTQGDLAALPEAATSPEWQTWKPSWVRSACKCSRSRFRASSGCCFPTLRLKPTR